MTQRLLSEPEFETPVASSRLMKDCEARKQDAELSFIHCVQFCEVMQNTKSWEKVKTFT